MVTHVSASTYETVQKWIARQLESKAPVTDAQRELLVNLEHTIDPLSQPQPEPELDINWIGVLQEYRAARTSVPGGGDSFTEAPVNPSSRGPSPWISQVTISEHPSPFPGPAGGLFADGTLPSFLRKKDAKKYAAKCAVEWLRENEHTPRAGGVKSPTAQQPAPQPLSPPINGGPLSTPKANNAPKVPAPVSPFDDTQPSAAYEVDKLCKELNIRPPKYKIEQDVSAGDFFSGYADFGMSAVMFPKGVGRVENILGKKAAKEKIAEKLVIHLQKMNDERQESTRKFLQGS